MSTATSTATYRIGRNGCALSERTGGPVPARAPANAMPSRPKRSPKGPPEEALSVSTHSHQTLPSTAIGKRKRTMKSNYTQLSLADRKEHPPFYDTTIAVIPS